MKTIERVGSRYKGHALTIEVPTAADLTAGALKFPPNHLRGSWSPSGTLMQDIASAYTLAAMRSAYYKMLGGRGSRSPLEVHTWAAPVVDPDCTDAANSPVLCDIIQTVPRVHHGVRPYLSHTETLRRSAPNCCRMITLYKGSERALEAEQSVTAAIELCDQGLDGEALYSGLARAGCAYACSYMFD